MNFEQFKDYAKDMVREYLPDNFRDASLQIHECEKLNTKYTGLIIIAPNQTASPTLNLDSLFQSYRQSEEQFKSDLINLSEQIRNNPEVIDQSQIFEYEKAKEHLFIRVSAAERNRQMLEHAPHQVVAGLAVTYHVEVPGAGEGIRSTIVNNQLMEQYGITKEQLHQDALENSMKLFPPTVKSMESLFTKILLGEDIRDSMTGARSEESLTAEIQAVIDTHDPMIVVTNTEKMHGAAAIFYPELLDKIGQVWGQDFFILPSSIHETIMVPDDGKLNIATLKEMVIETNMNVVSLEDKLADEVFHYDRKDRIFERAETFAERQNAKKHLQGREEKQRGAVQELARPKQKRHDMEL